jgi:hypothetical protein
MKTVKNLWIAGLFCWGLMHGVVSSAAVVSLNLTGPVQAGSTFDVDVWVNDLFSGLATDDQLASFGFNVVNGSPGLFRFINSTIRPPFDDDSAYFGLDAAGSPFPAIDNIPTTQSLWLATLTFDALAAGSGTLGVRTELTAPNQGLIFVLGAPIGLNADLTVNVAPVPLPAALWMLLGGVTLLGRFVRRGGPGA